MYRMRNTVLVKYGKFKEYYEILEKLRSTCWERGWVEPKHWAPLAGRDNEITTERVYENLEDWTKENEAWHTDDEVMGIVREASDLVEPGSSQTFIEEEAFEIA